MNRWIWTFIIVVCVLILLGFIGWSTGRWERDPLNYGMASAETLPCVDAETAEKIRGVMLEAIDDALKQQIVHVFEVWMKDERDQPSRARTGARRAIRAYVGSRKGVAEWQPIACPN